MLRYYHGRSRLGTWLRSVLSQRHVDGIRAARRLRSIDDPDEGLPEPVAEAAVVEPGAAARMQVAAACVSAALAALDAPSRLRLAYYYVHGLTLAEAGRLFGEHEATASRKLEKARAGLRGARSRRPWPSGACGWTTWRAGATWPARRGTRRWPRRWGRRPPPAGTQGTARPSFKGKRTP